MTKFKNFQIRFREPLGDKENPYMIRWVLVVFGFSIRIHHWISSDDLRAPHDHAWDFLTLVLKGFYVDRTPEGEERLGWLSCKFRKAEHKHSVVVPESGCWTLLLTGRSKRKWRFYPDGKPNGFRPLRYFSKYGHH